MPATYRIDVPDRLVWTHLWGRVTIEEIMALAQHLRADPRFDPAGRQLVMVSGADPALITESGIRQIAGLGCWGPGARRALVLRTALGFGIARQYISRSATPFGEIATFSEVPEALAWLGLPTDWEPPPASPDDPVFEIPPG